jgi:hypothetical protein
VQWAHTFIRTREREGGITFKYTHFYTKLFAQPNIKTKVVHSRSAWAIHTNNRIVIILSSTAILTGTTISGTQLAYITSFACFGALSDVIVTHRTQGTVTGIGCPQYVGIPANGALGACKGERVEISAVTTKYGG